MRASAKPFISVVIPVYNAEKYIADAINSVLTQTYRSIEIIIIDDGSQDGSLAIIKSYNNYPNIKIISQENQGVTVTRNNGIEAANGEYIAFLDADDLWIPEKLEKQVEVLDNSPQVSAVFTQSGKIDEKGSRIPGGIRNDISLDVPFCPYHHLLMKGNPFCMSSALVSKQALLGVNCFREERLLSLDYDIWLRLAAENNNFYLISEPLTEYRVLSNSLLHGSLEKEYGAQLKIFELHKHRYNLTTSCLRKSRIFYEWADSAFYVSDRSALRAITKAIAYNPFSFKAYWLFARGLVKKMIYCGV